MYILLCVLPPLNKGLLLLLLLQHFILWTSKGTFLNVPRNVPYHICSCNYERAAGSDPTVCEDQKMSGLNRDKIEDETVFSLFSLLTRDDVSPEDFDESIPVGTRLFVEESQSVT